MTPGHIDENLLEQIRSASDIADIVGAAIPLKKTGATFKALCPFHKEKTPSFHVNPRTQSFHCFGCHKGGDVFRFLMEHESLNFIEAVVRLAERARIPLPEREPGDSGRAVQKDALLRVVDAIAQRWHKMLLNDTRAEPARRYLEERQINAEAVKLFQLGHAPAEWRDTVDWGRAQGFSLELLEAAGLVVRREDGDGCYDRFRGRLMFPICDEQSRVIGFSGRVLPGDDDPRKYVNTPETLLFHKSRVFFGLDKSKRDLLDAKSAIVCEGQLDLIRCFTNGVRNIVAPQGTALTSDHARILKRYVSEVVLCFDSDQAGQNAAIRSLDDLLASGLAIRVAQIPPPEDPDSYVRKHGGEAFRQLIDSARGFYDFYLDLLCSRHDPTTDRGQAEIARAMSEAVSKAGDPLMGEKYARKVAAKLGLSPMNAVREFARLARGRKAAHEPAPSEADGEPESDAWRPGVHESWLLKLVLLREELLDWTVRHLDPVWIRNPLVREVLELRLARGESGAQPEPAQILRAAPGELHRRLITEAMVEEREIPNPAKQLEDVLIRLRNDYLDQKLGELMAKLGDSSLSESEKLKAVVMRAELSARKRAPLLPLEGGDDNAAN